MLKAIIFDMDGVIIDSEPQHEKAALRVFSRYGIDADAKYHAKYIGSSTRKMAEETIAQFHLTVAVEKFLEELNQEKKTVLKEEGYQPLPGILELIKKLRQKGIHLAIASSSSPSEIEHAAKALGLRKYFDKFISSAHVKNPKPAPDIFLEALKEMGVSPKEAVIVEDSCNGCLAAKAAKTACVGYVNLHSGSQDLSSADVLLESFEGIDERFFHHILQRSQGLPVTIANTRRLIIRELTPEDTKEIYKMYQDPDIRRYIPEIDDYLEIEMEKQAAYIRNVYSFYGFGIWGVYSKTSGKLIGKCGIENQMVDGIEEISLSYLLDSKYWGYGYAIECGKAVFNYAKSQLDITRVVAVIDEKNKRSIRTAQNLDMVLEKEVLYKNRKCHLYSIAL